MNDIQEFCEKQVLVLTNLNEEKVIITEDYWGELAGKKMKVFSLRESYENHQRKGSPDDPLKFYVIWKEGEEEQIFFAKKVWFSGYAGSSFNVADHLASLGMTNVTLAAFVKDGPKLNDLHQYCKKVGMNFVPLLASNTATTFVFRGDDNADSVVCMEKPTKIYCDYNRSKLEEKWDVIISSSTPANIDVLKMVIELFKKNSKAIKTLIPSLALINSDDKKIKLLFRKLISLSDVFQVNDLEAGRYLDLNSTEFSQGPIHRKKLILSLVKELKVSTVIVTMGKDGAAVVVTGLDSSEKKYIHQSAMKKNWVVKSTVGSGDAFHAGFLSIFIRTKNNTHDICLALATRMGSEIAIRNACVWGGNMSQDHKKRLPMEGFMNLVHEYQEKIS
jgi:sugar/nucleoside kinase (ribokinase family)